MVVVVVVVVVVVSHGGFPNRIIHSTSHHFGILNSIRATFVTKLWDFWTFTYYQSIQTGSYMEEVVEVPMTWICHIFEVIAIFLNVDLLISHNCYPSHIFITSSNFLKFFAKKVIDFWLNEIQNNAKVAYLWKLDCGHTSLALAFWSTSHWYA